MSDHLLLKSFDPKKMKDDAVTLVIGRRRTGKSWIARDILYHKQHLPVGIAMSGTEEGNGFYSDYIPDSFVYNKYDPETLRTVMNRQKKLVHNKHPFPNAFVILDDCAYDRKIFLGDTPLREIFMNGRHWKLFTLITLQWVMDMPPSLRQNIDYVIVLKDNIRKNLKKLHENFFGIIDDFEQFVTIMRQVTEGHGALVLDNTSDSNDITKMLFWFKARPRTFRMGTAEYWRQHNKRYNPKHMLQELGATTKKKSSLVVEKV